jgi:hypothetical protein
MHNLWKHSQVVPRCVLCQFSRCVWSQSTTQINHHSYIVVRKDIQYDLVIKNLLKCVLWPIIWCILGNFQAGLRRTYFGQLLYGSFYSFFVRFFWSLILYCSLSINLEAPKFIYTYIYIFNIYT